MCRCLKIFSCSCRKRQRGWKQPKNTKSRSLSVAINNLTHLLSFICAIYVTSWVQFRFSTFLLFIDCPFAKNEKILPFSEGIRWRGLLNPHKIASYVFIWVTYDSLHVLWCSSNIVERFLLPLLLILNEDVKKRLKGKKKVENAQWNLLKEVFNRFWNLFSTFILKLIKFEI